MSLWPSSELSRIAAGSPSRRGPPTPTVQCVAHRDTVAWETDPSRRRRKVLISTVPFLPRRPLRGRAENPLGSCRDRPTARRREVFADSARLPGVVAGHRNRCWLAAHRTAFRQGIHRPVDRSARAWIEDPVRQPRPGRGTSRS